MPLKKTHFEKKKINNQNCCGFTLVEFLIYSTIVTFVVGGLVLTGINVLQGRARVKTVEEVNHNGKMAMEKIASHVRKAEDINHPEAGNEADYLSLAMFEEEDSPTVFNVEEGALMIKRGVKDAKPITAEAVKIESLKFTNVSYPDGGTVRVETTMEHDDITGRVEYGFKRSFYTTENLRGGQKEIECTGFTYDPIGSWYLEHSGTEVRDYHTHDNSSATVTKDIYCDNEGWNPGACVFWTHNATAPSGEICVSPNDDVYINALWDKEDQGEYEYGQYGDELSTLNVVGGTHSDETGDLIVGEYDTNVEGEDWLDENYDSATYTFSAMDACTAKGKDWKLPNIRELDSIRDQSKASDPYSELPGIQSAGYVSSTEESSFQGWAMWFEFGDVDLNAKNSSRRVRCVRR